MNQPAPPPEKKAGHTPGPWPANEPGSWSYLADGRVMYEITLPDGCQIIATGKDGSAVAANAGLINASPQMYDALRGKWEHMDDKGQTFYCNCPMYKSLSFDSSVNDFDRDHATSCVMGRVALRAAEGAGNGVRK